MAKASGGTRASSSSSARGLSTAASGASRLVQQEAIAERFYANGELRVDPGDAVYANMYSFTNNPTAISDSIENLTDYDAIISDNYVQLLPRNYDSADLIADYGDDSFRIPFEDRSLMDVIQELRSSSMSSLFGKYR